MAKVKMLGGDFDKLDAKFAKADIIFTLTDGKLSVMKVSDVTRTYFADQGAVRLPNAPRQLRADFDEARKTWPEPANMEVVLIFKDSRWAYIRATNRKDAKVIHSIAPDDQPAPPLGEDDGGEENAA
jgi:hypothetical protein